MLVIPLVFIVALLILSGYGAYVLIMGVFNPMHLLFVVVVPLAVLFAMALIFKLVSAAIARWRDRK